MKKQIIEMLEKLDERKLGIVYMFVLGMVKKS